MVKDSDLNKAKIKQGIGDSLTDMLREIVIASGHKPGKNSATVALIATMGSNRGAYDDVLKDLHDEIDRYLKKQQEYAAVYDKEYSAQIKMHKDTYLADVNSSMRQKSQPQL